MLFCVGNGIFLGDGGRDFSSRVKLSSSLSQNKLAARWRGGLALASREAKTGGADRDRTCDPHNAIVGWPIANKGRNACKCVWCPFWCPRIEPLGLNCICAAALSRLVRPIEDRVGFHLSLVPQRYQLTHSLLPPCSTLRPPTCCPFSSRPPGRSCGSIATVPSPMRLRCAQSAADWLGVKWRAVKRASARRRSRVWRYPFRIRWVCHPRLYTLDTSLCRVSPLCSTLRPPASRPFSSRPPARKIGSIGRSPSPMRLRRA